MPPEAKAFGVFVGKGYAVLAEGEWREACEASRRSCKGLSGLCSEAVTHRDIPGYLSIYNRDIMGAKGAYLCGSNGFRIAQREEES